MELFGTAGIRGETNERFTPEFVLRVARAVGERIDGTVVLARDGRTTGPALLDAAAAGFSSAGVDVHRAGALPTPALAFASRGRHGAMLTASHNPPGDNGIKLFVDGREYDARAEAEIESILETDPSPVSWDRWGTRRSIDVLDAYRAAVVSYARSSWMAPEGHTIAIDCANGMAGPVTPRVLESLGANVRALNANVDGHFPSHASKPTSENLGSFRAFVAESEATCGFAHDGDADRIVVVDGNGEIVHEDTITAILAERFVEASTHDDPVVVTTPNTSSRIDERVEVVGGRIERVRLGALQEGVATVRERAGPGEVVFAAEPWKHVHPELGPWIDGVASAAVLAGLIAAEGLETLCEPITERPYRKVAIDCPEDRKTDAMVGIERRLPETLDGEPTETHDGIRIDRPDGSWLLVRPSGTEPKIRLYVESESVDTIVERARGVIETAIEG